MLQPRQVDMAESVSEWFPLADWSQRRMQPEATFEADWECHAGVLWEAVQSCGGSTPAMLGRVMMLELEIQLFHAVAAAARSAQPWSPLEQLVPAAFLCLSECLASACMAGGRSLCTFCTLAWV